MSDQTPNLTEPRATRAWWVVAGYVVGVLGLVALLLVWTTGPSDPAEEPEAAATTTTTVAVEAQEEPVADAAEIILPSVVHIRTAAGVGSGVIFDSDGLIITAAHVVEGNDEVLVRFDTGEQVPGMVLGTAPDVDIAVIEVDRSGLPTAIFELEKPRVGQLAVAVGSPWNLESTVTSGIVSAVDRAHCTIAGCMAMVQTDAAINPGNSGGALVDRAGNVIGINVSIFTRTGANDGVGFAVPSLTAVDYAESIISGEPIEVAFLGVRGGFSEGDQAGAVIEEVVSGSAAEEAGLQVDDVVISFDGVVVRDPGDLAAQVRSKSPGEAVEIVLLRNGEQITIQATLGEREDDVS